MARIETRTSKFLFIVTGNVAKLVFDISRGQTALHKAATARQRAVCCMLVAAGSSLTLADRDGSTARQLAEKAGDTDLAIYLESQLFLCTFYKFHE
jgi:hypothetical protein